ncbi:unnamed protein product [Tuber melanosporum]|uniref:(Perigord truffle) hypothetical protein n=1 Tax=Tuber melanosporum (strain Mel28) TaxID=656061 RepID=D5G5Y5_TUBMM|nr:uncharacterized protein GSTUM_00001626001 [Tuber melanosporum]CAZ79928.1 unnamed protein product [Tuber melanosporum]
MLLPRDYRVRLEAMMDRGCSQKFYDISPSSPPSLSPSDLIVPASKSLLANHPANSSVYVPNLSIEIYYQPHI